MMALQSIVRFSIIRLFFLLCPLLLMPDGGAVAQTGDILLSSEPREPIFAADGQIQSSGRIGSRRLAVWGTSEARAGEVVNVLRMQMLQDTALLGPQASLCTEEARPYGFVQVIPLARSFLVVWNDRRSASPGTYVRVIGLGGAGTPETRIWSGAVDTAGVFLVESGSEPGLVWSGMDGADGIYVSRLNRDVTRIHTAVRLAEGRLTGIQRPFSFPAITVLERANKFPVVVGASWQILGLAGASEKLILPYYMADDGKVITLQGNLVRQYRTILDSIPFRTTTVQLPGDAVGGSLVAMYDSLGRIRIFYATGGGFANGMGEHIISELRTITELSPGNFSPPARVGARLVTYSSGHCEYITAGAEKAGIRRGPENRYNLDIEFKIGVVFDCHGVKTTNIYTHTITHSFSERGGVEQEFPERGFRYPDGGIFRVPSMDASEVDVVVGTRLKRLKAAVHRDVVSVPQQSPILQLYGDEVLVGWLSAGFDTTAALVRWSGEDVVERLPSLPVRMERELPHPYFEVQNTKTFFTQGGRAILVRSRTWGDYNSAGIYVRHDTADYYIPAPDGWKSLRRGSAKTLGTLMKFAFSPEKRELVGMWGRPSGMQVSAYDEAGKEVWRIDSCPMGAVSRLEMLPTGEGEFVMIDPYGTARVTSTSFTPLSQEALPTSGLFLSMLGGRYLRSYIGDPITLDLYDRNGVVLHHGTVAPVSNPVNQYIVQNPADSGIAILYTGDGGVKMVTLDKELKVVDSTQVISATKGKTGRVAAAFKGDLLYVVWEDFRTPAADIYGTVVRARTRGD